MRSTRGYIAVLLCAAGVALPGCGTAPSGDRSATAPVSAEPPPQVVVDEATRDEFARAIKALAGDRLDEAQRLLTRLTERHPDLYGPHANLGILYARTGEIDAAEQALKKAIALKPDAAEPHNQLGILYRNAGRFEEARAAYERAVEVEPRYANAHLNLGILYDIYLLDYKKAMKHYRRYQRLTPGEDEEVSMWIADLKRRQ